jgi:hypothetical protein
MIITNRTTTANYALLENLLQQRSNVVTPVKQGVTVVTSHAISEYNRITGVTMSNGDIVIVPFGEPVPLTKFQLIGYMNDSGKQYGAWIGTGLIESEQVYIVPNRETMWNDFINQTPVEQVVEVSKVDNTTQVELVTIRDELNSRVYENLVEYGVTTVGEMVGVLEQIINGEVEIKYVGEKTAIKLLEQYADDTA